MSDDLASRVLAAIEAVDKVARGYGTNPDGETA